MARHNSPQPLPTVSYTVVEDDIYEQRTAVSSWMRSYGYNEYSEFNRPENHYIRYIEPLESDLAKQVEYDMDEQDQEWVDALNIERKAHNSERIPYEVFEIVMDRLEKEWFDLTKNISKPDLALPSEDSTCNICDDAEGENTNAIVFCDGCNLAVHQDCYGVPYIPEGQWLCRKCTVSPEVPVSCKLCPMEGGAFKQTIHGEWVHLLCAIWVPETRVANEVLMEPVIGVEQIPKSRWRLRCTVCGDPEGACIQCSRTTCAVPFHATCGRAAHLLMPMKAAIGAEAPSLQSFCERHLPKEQAEIRRRASEAEAQNARSDATFSEAESDVPNAAQRTHRHAHAGTNAKSNKSARAHAKTYKPGPPLVPALILNRVLQYTERLPLRKRNEFVELCARYWSLKREARRGAPLLKRLHLEPWTATGMQTREQTVADKEAKLQYMVKLRKDLEQVRLLTDVCRKREKEKRARMEVIRNLFRVAVFPSETGLQEVFTKIIALDVNKYFAHPVSKSMAEDYYEIIKNPMCWDGIQGKLDRHEYWDVQAFKSDILLVLDNAMLYNKPDTAWYKAASRIKGNLEAHFKPLDALVTSAPLEVAKPPSPSQEEAPAVDTAEAASSSNAPANQDDPPTSPESSTLPALGPIGDLEPPLAQLELLFSDAIKDESQYNLGDTDPIAAVFAYEFGTLKPPPPPPPPKAKRGRKQQQLDASAGFRAPPRTRRAVAAAEASGSAGPSAPAPVPIPVPGEETTEKTEKTEKGKTRAKPRQPPPAVVVENVDGAQSFKLFEQGWVLPPGTKRGGARAPHVGSCRLRRPRSARLVSGRRFWSVVVVLSVCAAARSQRSETHGTPATESQTLHETGSSAPVLEATSAGGPTVEAASAGAPSIDADISMRDAAELVETSPSGQAVAAGTAAVEAAPPIAPATDQGPSPDIDMQDATEPVETSSATQRETVRAAGSPVEAAMTAVAGATANDQVPSADTSMKEVAKLVGSSSTVQEEVSEAAGAVGTIMEGTAQNAGIAGLAQGRPGERPASEAPAADALSKQPSPLAEAFQQSHDTGAASNSLAPVAAAATSDTGEPSATAKDGKAVYTRKPDGDVRAAAQQPEGLDGGAMAGDLTPVHEEQSAADVSMDVDVTLIVQPIERPAPSSSLSAPPSRSSISAEPEQQVLLEPNEKIVEQPDGERVIEEEDSPEARRAKNMLRKSLRTNAGVHASAAGPSDAGPSTAPSSKPPSRKPEPAVPLLAIPEQAVAGPSRMDLDDASELSELSGIESEEEEVQKAAETKKVGKSTKAGKSSAEVVQRRTRGWNLKTVEGKGKGKVQDTSGSTPGAGGGEVELEPGEMLPGGTLVWAKAHSYPWWPAVVFEEDDPLVTPNVLKEKKKVKTDHGPPHLVRFYDKHSLWQWLGLDKIKMLGEDAALDAEFREGFGRQKFRSPKLKKECQEAYQQALGEREEPAAESSLSDVASER